VLGHWHSGTLAIPTAPAQDPKSEKGSLFYSYKSDVYCMLWLCWILECYLCYKVGSSFIHPGKTFAYQTSRVTAVMLNKCTMEEARSVLNPSCGNPVWAVRVCGQAEFLIWSALLPLKKKKKYIYISRSQYVKGNGDHILGLGQSNFGGHFWRECCFRIVMPDYTLVTPQWTSWNTWNGEILPHTPCSPDLAWSDFQMFPKIMKHLQGLHLHNDKNVKE